MRVSQATASRPARPCTEDSYPRNTGSDQAAAIAAPLTAAARGQIIMIDALCAKDRT